MSSLALVHCKHELCQAQVMHVNDTHWLPSTECRVNVGWNTGLAQAGAARLGSAPYACLCKQGTSLSGREKQEAKLGHVT